MASAKSEVIITFTSLDSTIELPIRRITSQEQSFKLPIGRASRNDFKNLRPAVNNTWFDSPVMSRDHATLSTSYNSHQKHIYIRDNASMHGTFMNDRRIEKNIDHLLPNGAHITFGCEVIRGLDRFPSQSFRVHYEWKTIDPPSPGSDQPVPDFLNTIACPLSSAEDSDVMSVSDASYEHEDEDQNTNHGLSSEPDVDSDDDDDRSVIDMTLDNLGSLPTGLQHGMAEEIESSDISSNVDGPDEEPITFSSSDAATDRDNTADSGNPILKLKWRQKADESNNTSMADQGLSTLSNESLDVHNSQADTSGYACKVEVEEHEETLATTSRYVAAASTETETANDRVDLPHFKILIGEATQHAEAIGSSSQSRISIDHLVNKPQGEQASYETRYEQNLQGTDHESSEPRSEWNLAEKTNDIHAGSSTKRKAMEISRLIEKEENLWSQMTTGHSSAQITADDSPDKIDLPSDKIIESSLSSPSTTKGNQEPLGQQHLDQEEEAQAPRKKARNSSHLMSALVGAIVGSVGVIYALAATAPPPM